MLKLKVIAFLWDLETFQVMARWVCIDNIFILCLNNKKKDSATYQSCYLLKIKPNKCIFSL